MNYMTETVVISLRSSYGSYTCLFISLCNSQAVVLMHIADAYWEKRSLLDTIIVGRTNLKNKVKVMVDYSFSAYIYLSGWFE